MEDLNAVNSELNDDSGLVSNWVFITTEQYQDLPNFDENPNIEIVKDNENLVQEVHNVEPSTFDCSAIEKQRSPQNETSVDMDEANLKDLLNEFDLESAFEYLKAAKVSYRSLQYLQKEDLKEAIPPLGLRVEFREKLFAWKKSKFGIDDETMSMPSKVEGWLKNNSPVLSPSPGSSSSNLSLFGKLLNKDLTALLGQTSKGANILEHYKQNQLLTNTLRNDIINIIIEEIISNNLTLKAHDFPYLVNEICLIFPTEKDVQEYYFIPRKGRNNPGGKLFAKYKNKRSKRMNLESPAGNKSILGADLSLVQNNQDKETTDTSSSNVMQTAEVDESIAVALKTSLSRESSDWREVCDKWKKTFSMRQKDLKEIESYEFIQSWPKLLDSRAPELINIDFSLMYPSKELMLFSKWENFKEKIQQYYSINIHNDYCKQLLSLAKSSSNKDVNDYLIITLLNAVLPSSARFKNNVGKRSKKATIIDAQESFVLRLVSINDYQKQIDDVINKYYSAGLTCQPFLIVEGASDENIKGFYIYFNNVLYKFSSFIESLDICFKILQTLSLKYPEASHFPWVFIQQFFYEINTVFDSKSPNIVSIINFL